MKTGGVRRPCPGRRRLLGLVLLLACAGAAWAQVDEGADEAHVKAAFLYKFTGYVDWPDSAFDPPGASFVIGVQGSPALLGELSQLIAGRKIHERPVQVRSIAAGDSLDGLQVLFVGRSESFRGEASSPVLIVTEADGSMPRGSMINFLVIDRHVRFVIALPTVEQAGLRMSSRLLSVAQKVIQAEEH